MKSSLTPAPGLAIAWALQTLIGQGLVAAPASGRPDPGQAGPFVAGHTSIMLWDASRSSDLGNRPIPIEVFYPVNPSAVTASTPEAIYPLDPINGVWPDTVSSEWEALGHDPAYENPPASHAGPFPVVVFSPGWGASIWAHNYLGTRLASHGIVVAVMYHYGDYFFPGEQIDHIATACLNRPKDQSFVLTRLLELNQTPGSPLAGLMDANRAVAAGWSLGGYASIVQAGGVDNVADIFTRPGWDFDGPPPLDTFVAVPPDTRFKAIIPLDGSSWIIPFHQLARVRVPSLAMGQSWATLEAFDPGFAAWQARQHAAFQGHPNYRADVLGAVHQSFSNWPEGFAIAHNRGLLTDEEYDLWCSWIGCDAPLASHEANELVSKYIIAFIKTVVAQGPSYQSMLTPGHALRNEPNIEFFVTEKRSPQAITEEWPNWPDTSIYFTEQPGNGPAGVAGNAGQRRVFGLWR